MATNAPSLDDLYDDAGHKYNIDPLRIKAHAIQETGERAKVASGDGKSWGFGQFRPATWAMVMPGVPLSARGDPATAIEAMGKYLAQLDAAHTDANGNTDVRAATAAYNGSGPAADAYAESVRGIHARLTKSGGLKTSRGQAPAANDDDAFGQTLKASPAPAAPDKEAADDAFGQTLKGGPAQEATPFKPETAETRRIGDLMTPGPPTATPPPAPAPPNINVPGVSGPPHPLDFGRVGQAAREGYDSGAVVTPAGIELADRYGLGSVARGVNMVTGVGGAVSGGALNILGQAADTVLPGSGRDAVMGAQLAAPFVMAPAGAARNVLLGDVARTAVEAERATGAAAKLDRASPLSPEFKAGPMAPGVAEKITPPAGPQAAGAVVDGWRRMTPGEPMALGQQVATDAHGQQWVRADGAPRAAGAEATSEPIPPPTPAQKATALQKMVGQSAEDRLTPQGRDDNVYFPGVERPEAMRDFTPAADGEMSAALQHKTLYNTDSHYHDQHDAQVKRNNAVMTDGTTLPNGTRVDGLKDMFGDANTRDKAMDDARDLMPGSIDLFKDEKPVDVQPIADKIKQILASGAGKTDAVANTLKGILPKLYDAEGKAETLPSIIKGIFDDINNKLYDKSPTTEGNAARVAANQLKDIKSVVSDVIGQGLPGTKWQDYLTNLSAALGHVSKLDYMQRFLSGSKGLWGSDGMLKFNKVNTMLEDIRQHHADQTGGARQMTMDEINKIEAVRNELAAKDLLDRRAGVRGSPTVQLASGAGKLGSGPLGTAVKTIAEGGAHLVLGHTTAGVGNVGLLAVKGWRAGRQAKAAQKEANALAVTKSRLLDTEPNPLAGP